MAGYTAYVDESGSKAKASTEPTDGRELGLAVAIVVRASVRDVFLDSIRQRLPASLSDDSHITDWGEEEQSCARSVVFEEVGSKALVVYDALTAVGFHHTQHTVPEQMRQTAKDAARGHVKVSKSHHDPHSHADLLANVMTKVRAVLADQATEHGCDPRSTTVDFVVDRVDAPILDAARKLIAAIDTAGATRVRKVTGYDTDSEEVVERAIVTRISGLGDLSLPQYSVSIGPKSNCGVFAADVVANALHKHLRETVAEKGHEIKLNQAEAVLGFALRGRIAGLSDGDASDILYGFPDGVR